MRQDAVREQQLNQSRPEGVENVDLSTAGVPASLNSALADFGICQKGLDTLNPEQVRVLGGLLASGEKRGALILRMFNAVSENSPKRAGDLVLALSNYGGSFPVLAEFLLRIGHDDPYKATDRAQILYLPAEDVPSARGASGHILKGTAYGAYDCQAPANSLGYFSKRQAISKIFEAFNGDRFNAQTRTETKQQRAKILREELDSITIDDLENDTQLVKEIGSPLIARNLAVYQELRKAIATYQEHVESLLFSGAITLPHKGSLRVAQDVGRQLMGWFDEHIRENENVPRGIVLAYLNLSDPDVYLTPTEEREWLRGLLAYQRVHSFIDKKAALGGVAGDIAEYDRLAPNDPLGLDDAVAKARHQVEELSERKGVEITVAQYAQVIELTGMVKFRVAVNQRILAAYGEEFDQALSYFDFVSFENGKRRADSYQEPVPMDRLKNHLLGAKIGVTESHYTDEKKQAVLGQKDFYHVANAQNLFRMANNREKALIAWPIQEFRQMVRGVMVAYRKAQYLDAQLEKFLASEAGQGIVIDRENIGDVLVAWKPKVLSGSKWHPAEILIDQHGSDAVLDMRNVYQRMKDGHSHVRYAAYYKDRVEDALSVGLVGDRFRDEFERLHEELKQLVPSEKYRDLLDRAMRVLSHPMVEATYNLRKERLIRKYFDEKDIEMINQVIAAEEKLAKIPEGYQAELGSLADFLRLRRGMTVIKGAMEIDNETGRRNIILDQVFHDRIFKPEEDRLLKIYDPAQIAAVKEFLEGKCVSLKSVGAEWIEKLKFLCSNRSQSALNKNGFSMVSKDVHWIAERLYSSEHSFINRKFVDNIERLFEAVKG